MMEAIYVGLISFLVTLVILSPVFVWCWLENKRINVERKEIEADIERLKNKVYDFTSPPYVMSPLVAFLKALSG